jgi:hypothetical protein
MPSSLSEAAQGALACSIFCALISMIVARRPGLWGTIGAAALVAVLVAMAWTVLGEAGRFSVTHPLFWTLVLQPWRGKVNAMILSIVLITVTVGRGLQILIEGTDRQLLFLLVVGISVGTLVGSLAGTLAWGIEIMLGEARRQ